MHSILSFDEKLKNSQCRLETLSVDHQRLKESHAFFGFQVTSHEVSDDEDEDPIIVVPLQRISETNFFRFQRNPSSGEFLVGFKPNSFLVMMHPRNGRDLRAFVCIGKEFLECDGDTIVRYLRRFEGLESLSIDFQKRTAKLKL